MDSSNLSVIFAPNLFHCGEGAEKMSSSTEKRLRYQAAAVQCLIDNAAALGKHALSMITLREITPLNLMIQYGLKISCKLHYSPVLMCRVLVCRCGSSVPHGEGSSDVGL